MNDLTEPKMPDPVMPDPLRQCTHFVTVTLNPDLMNKHRMYQQLKLTSDKIKGHCQALHPSIWVAELTKKANIHYHIMVKCDEMEAMLLIDDFKTNKKYGYIDIQPIKNHQKTYEYLIKNVTFTYNVLHAGRNKNNVPQDIWNIYLHELQAKTKLKSKKILELMQLVNSKLDEIMDE